MSRIPRPVSTSTTPCRGVSTARQWQVSRPIAPGLTPSISAPPKGRAGPQSRWWMRIAVLSVSGEGNGYRQRVVSAGKHPIPEQRQVDVAAAEDDAAAPAPHPLAFLQQ